MNELFPYLRKARYDDKFYSRTEVPGKCNIFEQEYQCELKRGDVVVKYKLTQYVYLFMNNFALHIKLNEDISRSLGKLMSLYQYYTAESISDAFNKYPYTLLVLKNDSSINWTAVRYSGGDLVKVGVFPTKNSFYNNCETAWVDEVRLIADGLMKELSNLVVDFSKLKRIEIKKSEIDMPVWLKRTLAIGGVIIIKFAVKSLINNIDIDLPFGDNDTPSVDIDTGDVEMPDFTDSNDIFNNVQDNSFNLSFKGGSCWETPECRKSHLAENGSYHIVHGF